MTTSLATGPAHGAVTLTTGGSFEYVPDDGFVGTDSFAYAADDGERSDTATVTIQVTNAAPTAAGDTTAAVHGRPAGVTVGPRHQVTVNVLANDADPDGDQLKAVVQSGPSHGSLTLNADGTFTFTPTAGYVGDDSFSYKATDGLMSSPPATVTLSVTNAAPTAADDSYATPENTTLTVPAAGVLGNDGDPDADAMMAVLVATTTHGALALGSNGGFTYTPAADYYGPDAFTYKASDGLASGATATVALTVVHANLAPKVTAPASKEVFQGRTVRFTNQSAPIRVDDSDAGQAPVSVSLSASAGALTLGGTGGLTFTLGDGVSDPAVAFTGTLDHVNAALDGLRFTAPQAPTAGVTVTVTAN